MNVDADTTTLATALAALAAALGLIALLGVRFTNIVLTVYVDDAQVAHDELLTTGAPIARGLEDTAWDHRVARSVLVDSARLSLIDRRRIRVTGRVA